MNHRLLLLLPILLIGMCAMAPVAGASSNVSVNLSLPTDSLLQGQVMAADLDIRNNEDYSVRIYKVGVHYDWMPEGTYYSLDYGNSYVQVESNTQTRPGQFLISCNKNTSVGYHKYFFKIDITRYDTASAAWVSDTVVTPPGYLNVDSPFRLQSLQLLQDANQSLNDARSANYTSKAAKLDMFNATSDMLDGWSAYNSNDFEKAINKTYNITLNLRQARTSESDFLTKKNIMLDMINAVNTRIVTLSGSDSPETRRLINESLSHLRQASLYLDAEDLVKAKSEVVAADTAINNAINAQFHYQAETNQTDESRSIAQNALDSARQTISKSDNLTSVPAGNLLREARTKMDSAMADFNDSAYINATNKASVAQALAVQAMKSDADYHQQQAREKISNIGQLSSPAARDELNESRTYYNQSLSDYARDDYRNAVIKADIAYALANNTTITEAAWKKSHPLNTAIPGFGAVPALIAILSVLIAIIVIRRR